MSNDLLRVLLVPDSIYWVTGTIAKSIARFNPWIEATVASGPVIDKIFAEQPELMRNFDLVHFTCPYASKAWLPRFREIAPCVTSHHHVTDWDAIKHNADGDAIIVGSPEWAEDLRARGVDVGKVFWVPYGVDAEQFKPTTDARRAATRSKLGVSQSAMLIGFFGKNSSNDDDRKGIDVFTEALLALKPRLPEFAVLIIGPGWQELVGSLNSSGVKCIWFPYIRELEGLSEMYHALDFYWVTARVEGGPVPLLEAMSSEVCCLTTAVGIARAIVRDGENALMLPFNNAQAFVEHTALLAGDGAKRRRFGRNARETILREMDVSVTATRVRDVYVKAFDNFEARRQSSESLQLHDKLQFVEPPSMLSEAPSDRGRQRGRLAEVVIVSGPTTPIKTDAIPLAGFPASMHRRVRMLETLAWSEHLILYHRQRTVALGMIMKEWARSPFSPLPARVLLRRFLPASLVAKVVKFKNRSETTVNAQFATPENLK